MQSGASVWPAVLLFLAFLTGIVLVVLGSCRLRRRSGGGGITVAAAVLGLGVALLAFFVLAFRHVGPNQVVSDSDVVPACDHWWVELSDSRGATEGEEQPSARCRDAAIGAVGPMVAESAGVGALIAGGSALLARRRASGATGSPPTPG